jgi:uncharacterized membrane protein (UPF0182 family)
MKGFKTPVLFAIACLLGLLPLLDAIAHIACEGLWFQEVGYFHEFVLRRSTQGAIWAIVFIATLTFVWGNLWLAEQLKYTRSWVDDTFSPSKFSARYAIQPPVPVESGGKKHPKPVTKSLSLAWVLGLGLAAAAAIDLVCVHYGAIAATFWHFDISQANGSIVLPSRLDLRSIGNWLSWVRQQPLSLAAFVLVAILLLTRSEVCLKAIAILFSAGCSLILSANWVRWLQFFHQTPFDRVDPVFQRDIGFFAFEVPIVETTEFWLMGTILLSFFSVLLVYLLSGNALSEGWFPGFSVRQQRHLQVLGGGVMLAMALRYWLRRYELLYSTEGATYGANFIDIKVRLPAEGILCLLAGLIGIMLLLRGFFAAYPPKPKSSYLYKVWHLYEFISPELAIGTYFIVAILSSWIVPAILQRSIVQPNELVLETPYIDRSINLTRAGFNLDQIEVKTFDPSDKISSATLQSNYQTIDNIRLWDELPLLETNRQLQQIRLYYKFPSAHLDRYKFKRTPTAKNTRTYDKRQVLISARELDYAALPDRAKTWINEHLVYTHGFGFTMSPVNTAAPSGLPEYFIKGIGTGGNTEESDSPIEVLDANIRASIPIGFPRIYYGELTNTYVMTSTNTPELDYPTGENNEYNTYDGRGGIAIDRGWRRWLLAAYLRDWQMLLTNNFKPDTKLLFRRNLLDRVRHIAPFLRYESSPYLVIADANLDHPEQPDPSKNYLYWIVDAYTTSDRYPYSDTGKHSFNYIRNSVKVIVDAYNGTVKFYTADSTDPILATYQKIFPSLFQPLDQLPSSLRSHLRYPVDLFTIQSERLLSYHMTDTKVFYNREDQWEFPSEIYRDKAQPVKPYYLIMKLPTEKEEEFVLLNPFTPTKRSNLIAWLASRSDGENYGKLLLYRFPKQELIFGPGQIEARINQQPLISQQMSLWNQQGSRVLKGNLLIIPIEQSLLYVEPIYLEAEENSLPTLVRTIVAYKDSITMAPTLQEALQATFSPEKLPQPSIIRSIEQLIQ